MIEEPLAGGNFGAVVRAGDTVRRPTGPWTPAVHALLSHLAAVGFDGAPRVLGIDEREREILTFVEGDVPHAWPPAPYVWEDETAFAIGALVRRYHDACAGFVPPPGARWRQGDASGEVICHHDVAPWNVVFREGAPVGLIDWDFAGPGPRLRDLGYAAWRFAPLYAPERLEGVGANPTRIPARLRLLADGYGLRRRGGLLDAAVERMQAMHDLLVGASDRNTRRLLAEGHHRSALEDAAWVRAQRDRLGSEL